MILKEMKISRMLEEHPITLRVLVEFSPHFNKLNNKILRKTLASRVNVEQAAGIAGVNLTQLLYRLNNAINKDFKENIESSNEMSESNELQNKPELLINLSKEKFILLDVRATISSGRDPFLDIMAVVKNLKDGEVLHLINSFEPLPLYTVLKNKGYEHWTEKEGNVCNVYFYTEAEKNIIETKSGPGEKTNDEVDYDNLIEIDVRNLEPPQPMINVLEKLKEVDERTVLVVHHHREPAMLFPKLEERGYQAVSNKIEENYFKVVITKKKDSK